MCEYSGGEVRELKPRNYCRACEATAEAPPVVGQRRLLAVGRLTAPTLGRQAETCQAG